MEKVQKAPDSMDHRSEDTELVRSVGSPSVFEETFNKNVSPVNEGDARGGEMESMPDFLVPENEEDTDLPQCKIKRNYSCNLCPFFSQNPRLFLYHSRDVHMDKIKIYECSQCLYASKHSQKLQRHISMIHVSGKTRKTRNRMVKPDRKSPRPIRPKPSDEPSLKEFSLLTEEQKLKLETENAGELEDTTDGAYKCSACNFKTINASVLRKHEKIVHLKKRYLKCSKCSYMTHVTSRFTKHVKYHSMPMIKCDLCDFRTPYKWNLDRHYKNHSGSGAFQCAKCNFRADIKQSLTVHEMNHHTPPVGQGAAAGRKRNRIGASRDSHKTKKDVEQSIEKEDVEAVADEEVESGPDQKGEEVSLRNLRNVKSSHNYKRETLNSHLQNDFVHPDDVVPRYGQIFVKSLKCRFCTFKAVFSHEIWRHEKRIHGYIRPDSKKRSIPKRPPPQLIPIQNKNNSSAILKIPSVRNQTATPTPDETNQTILDKPVNEKEFSEMCKKSSLTSSLKDFVSLIGDEEGLKTIPDSSRNDLETECSDQQVSEPADISESKNEEEDNKQKQTDLLKKKNASFFDKLKEKLLTVNSEEESLFCEVCGHESKCLSEAVAHQKRHSNSNYRSDSDGHAENDILLSGAELSSTRCQHCRQRCKTSTDLINHLKSCKAFEASLDAFLNSENATRDKVKRNVSVEREINKEDDCNGTSMENRVFVWNDLSQVENEEDDQVNEESLATSPGYGTVTSKGTDNTESGTLVMEPDPSLHVIVKKVFKCPHCSFWASTASRFHVHIVGHLNKKPFECSLCLYRSNWRWDITKHIRLKSLRDPRHSQAKVNMTDETGRRNYSKYNRFLTMMRVQEPTAESSGYGRRSRCGEVTQGNAADKDLLPFPLPEPPRLTRAPAPGASHQVPQEAPLRPPPPLKAAYQFPPFSVLKESAKKTVWKCKKCNFRDSHKGRVLLHVKKHYMVRKKGKSSRSNTSSSSNEGSVGGEEVDPDEPDSNSETGSWLKRPSYSCGHCHQVSNWKHVIQRHCKLKHNGDARIEVKWRGKIITPVRFSGEIQEERTDDPAKSFSCDICPFSTDTEGDLTAHKLNHIDRPGSIFKCTYCPFFVPSKIAVLEHMEIHKPDKGCDLTSLKVDNFDPDKELLPQKNDKKKKISRKYKCLQCPYISHSRTQFLYHKQFHRPRNSPFKCLYCTYNVTRRHLLHQHLRVHHNREGKIRKVEKQEKASKQKRIPEETEEKIEKTDSTDSLQLCNSDIPQVWVLKGGNVHKMFKCRWCPHVNARRVNIQEHEKMHTDDRRSSANDSSKFQCSDCNYKCYGAGVLASHLKVHKGAHGEIRSVVDVTRPESEQIQELQNSINIMEPEVVVIEGGNELEIVDNDLLSSQPENSHNHKPEEGNDECIKTLSFCDKCPGRFFFKKELNIHSKFHMIHLPFRCTYCTYTARQRPHLLSHYKVHGEEYQEKTRRLMKSYEVSSEHPQPKTIIISKKSYVMEGPVWGVTNSKTKNRSKISCPYCPSKFTLAINLQYHLSHHGGNNKYKCQYCDYSAKTYVNIIKHEDIHDKHNKETGKKAMFSYSFPISGTDLIQEEDSVESDLEAKSREEEQIPEVKAVEQLDESQEGKKVRIRKKKYKCSKCPSAFERPQQYEVHIALHGAKQKYNCDQCDYSVKYYANYAQHKKKHENSEDTKLEDVTLPNEDINKSPQEQQGLLMLQKQKKTPDEKEEEIKNFTCDYCPFYNLRKDSVIHHTWRHFLVSGVRSVYPCPHCDYSTSQNSFLKDHIKFHFNAGSRFKAEAYLKCENMELWCSEDAKDPKQVLIFHDRGEEQPDRFFPPISQYDSNEEDTNCKIRFKKNETCEIKLSHVDKVMKMLKAHYEIPKPKRNRNKNWRCKKCPHAFGKRDQYLRHISLHGSNQRHKCDICDYSVKFYANYVQHMRMHQKLEPDRVIHVKKNLQNLIENSERILVSAVSQEESCGDLIEKVEVECEFDTDDNSQDNSNLIIDETYEEKEEEPHGESLGKHTDI